MAKKEVVEKVDLLDQGLQRFALSGMSKQRADEAVNEEILLEKYTGEFLIKNKDGILISIDTINRKAAAFNNAVILAEQTGICGDIYSLEDSDIDMPMIMPVDLNILSEPVMLPNACTKLLLNLDISEYIYDLNSSTVKEVDKECTVDIVVKQGENQATISKKVTDVNKLVIDAKKEGLTGSEPVKLNSIILRANKKYASVAEHKIVLHNIFITVNK